MTRDALCVALVVGGALSGGGSWVAGLVVWLWGCRGLLSGDQGGEWWWWSLYGTEWR